MRTSSMAVAVCAMAVGLAAVPQAQPAPAPPQPGTAVAAKAPLDPRVVRLKAALDADVSSPAMYDLGQQMNDMVFSFGEIGFQEVETQRYLGKLLRDNGFTVEDGVAGIPTAWVAKWGSGAPVIAFGSDIDGIPQGNQKPGVAYHDPMVEGAPGHGEGHNSGTPLNIVAALAVKRIMEREKLPGTLMIWPGVAEELLGTKAYYVRAGLFKDVDVVLYNHVGANLGTSWGDGGGSGLVSVEYTFEGETAHSAGAPWRGRSALDAVELMNVGWNYRREHLRLAQRTHYVITNGGDQPNVVPRNASVWYYFRETDYEIDQEHVGHRRQDGRRRRADDQHEVDLARARHRLAAPHQPGRRRGDARQHRARRPAGVERCRHRAGQGDAAGDEGAGDRPGQRPDRIAARPRGDSRQREVRRPVRRHRRHHLERARPWSLSYPANFQAGPGHNWANAIPMATPIAHKGVNAGARVQALTALDLVLRPELVQAAKDYFQNVQLKQRKYTPFIRPTDQPAIWMNKTTMDRYRPEMRKYYFDSTKYKTYMDQMAAQFGIKYPTIKDGATQ